MNAEDKIKLNRIGEKIDSGEELLSSDFHVLRRLTDEDVSEAVRLLERIAAEKDQRAMYYLGGYYFEKEKPEYWDRAFAYYTGEGTIAITGEQQSAIKDILNHGKFNKRVLVMGSVFFLVTLLIMLLTSSVSVFYIAPAVKIILIIAEVLVLVKGISTYRKNPFHSLRWFLPLLLLIWCVYLLIWLL